MSQPLHLMIHPESDCAWLQNNCYVADLEISIAEFENWRDAPITQEEFLAYATERGLHGAEHYTFHPEIILFDAGVRMVPASSVRLL